MCIHGLVTIIVMTTITMNCVNLMVGTAATILIQKSTSIVTLAVNASLKIKCV